MEVVCEATQSTDTQVRVAALQCLVKIMSLYYHYMEPYMGQALFPVSKMNNDQRNFVWNNHFVFCAFFFNFENFTRFSYNFRSR